jgi:hypothetical protein
MSAVDFAELAAHTSAGTATVIDSIHEFGCVVVRNVPAVAEAREIAFRSAVALNSLSRPEFLAALKSAHLKTDNKSDDILSVVSYVNTRRGYEPEPRDKLCELTVALETLTAAMVDVAVLVLQRVGLDDVASAVQEGRNHKGRLIVYRPKLCGEWLGSHCDYGVITALLKPLLLPTDGIEEDCGLHVCNRDETGPSRHAEHWLGDSDLLLQLGESACCLSASRAADDSPESLKHILPCVHHVAPSAIATRVQFACFLCPNWDDLLYCPKSPEILSFWDKHRMPSLAARFRGQEFLTFHEFSQASTRSYWKPK